MRKDELSLRFLRLRIEYVTLKYKYIFTDIL